MKRIKTSLLIPGMIVAKDVHNTSNALVASKDTVLNDEAITKLTFHNIYSIFVTDESVAPAVETVTAPKEQVEEYRSKVTDTPEFKRFQEKYTQEVEKLQGVFNDIIKLQTKRPEISQLCAQATSMIEEGQSGLQIFDILHNIRNFDDSTFHHCLNVALICNVFADWLHMSPFEKETATVCGLLHDIGKLKIPEEIVKKASRLTDEEYNKIKEHPTEGCKILFDAKFNLNVQNAAMQHHERIDGTGYPLGLKLDKIDKYAKMVAIADVYDAMTAARVYRGALCPFKVIDMFEREGLGSFDPEYLLTFLENIVLTYMNSTAVLSDGRQGTIVMMNKQKLSRPVVLCGSETVNLMAHPEVSIERLII